MSPAFQGDIWTCPFCHPNTTLPLAPQGRMPPVATGRASSSAVMECVSVPVPLTHSVPVAATHPRGEYVLVIAGADEKALKAASQAQWEEVPVAEHVARYEAQGLDRKEAMKRAAADRGMTKREVYRALLEKDQEM